MVNFGAKAFISGLSLLKKVARHERDPRSRPRDELINPLKRMSFLA